MSILIFNSCQEQKNTLDFDAYPAANDSSLWVDYSEKNSTFTLWAPTAEEVILRLFKKGNNTKAYFRESLVKKSNAIWQITIDGNLNGVYYTYQVKTFNHWLNETPGIYAKAVGVNGQRAMVLDMTTTNPVNWKLDKGPTLRHANEAIIYELHIRDMTINAQSGSSMPGTYLGLVEEHTKGPNGITTGIDHIKELGITHVHLLPTFDHYSIDESKLNIPQFNWGYDPQNYNVPEGSFSSNPFNAEVRIKQFKQMIKTFHDNGIGVILDVVYNHTGKTEESNFNQEVPGYYYRQREDGTYSDAAACGNETASERTMMQKFMIESVSYWMEEYHIDGFRFDLMGIHDIATMNLLSEKINEINPNALIYGEGWTAADSPLPEEMRALKKHLPQLPKIAAFSDDLRDGLKGSVFEDSDTGFVSGAKNMEESMKFGIVGSIKHPEVAYNKVNYSDAPWSNEPWQAISYVSCHDNHTLYDKLKISCPDASEEQLMAMDKLANAIVLTSQGTAFLHAGSELLRTKNGAHNSYNLPDSVNQIDWNWKVKNKSIFKYYKNLITLRKKHPAFRMPTAKEVVKNLHFQKVADNFIAYTISNNANTDEWKTILIIYNATLKPVEYTFDGIWQQAVLGNTFDLSGKKTIKESVQVPEMSMYIAFQK